MGTGAQKGDHSSDPDHRVNASWRLADQNIKSHRQEKYHQSLFDTGHSSSSNLFQTWGMGWPCMSASSTISATSFW